MPLIDLKTDLKSLRYGKDTPGGGYSGQPYIQAKIPDGLEPKSSDFILRGGYLTVGDSLTDIKRLAKMFGDLKSPNGLFFIAKQNVLSNSAVRTQTSGIMNEGIYTPLSTLAQAGVVAFGGHLNKQGINPFAQTGAYAVGDGLYNSVVKPSQPLEENRLVQIYNSVKENRVIELKGFKFNEGGINVLTYKGGPGAPLGVGNTNIRFTNVRTGEASGINFNTYLKGIANSPTTRTDIPNYVLNFSSSLEFPIGSSATYQNLAIKAGINESKAKINNNIFQAYSFNVYTQGNTWPTTSPLIYTNNTFTYNQKDIIQSEVNLPSGNHLSPTIQDFRKVLRDSLGVNTPQAIQATTLGATPIAPNYVTKNMAVRVNIGDPGQRANKSYASYSSGVLGPDGKSVYTGVVKALDKINALPIYRSEAVDTNLPVNDLVKFRIAAIDNNNPQFKTFMHFRAFIDSFNDNYNASWGSVKYLGRGENFYNYNGFDRTISLSFTVAAQSKQELIPMYKKLNYLASNLTPDYSPFGYMRGPLVQLTMGGYLYEQVGFITSLTYDIPQDTTWEIGINDTAGEPSSNATTGLDNLQRLSDSSVKELPHRINVSSFQFTPIHDFRPGKQGLEFGANLGFNASGSDAVGFVTTYGPQRYIALEAVTNNYDDNPQDL